MTGKFWDQYSIKGQEPSNIAQTPAKLVQKLRAGRVDVSKMSSGELASHMTDESKLLANIREASGLPAVRPTQDDYSALDNKFNLVDTGVTPPDVTIVNRRKP